MKILIPARGGSKRIPKKNLVDLNGKPLLYYTIQTCKKITKEVYVSTDSDDIKNFANKMGVNIINRPNFLSKDITKTEDVVEHFLKKIETNLFCVVQPTSPFVKKDSILDGLRLSENYDSVISVCKDVKYFWDSRGKPINFVLGKRDRTQNHEAWFRENGAFYITKKDNFLKNKILQNGLVGFIKMNEIESIDIDNYDDLKMARMVCNY